MNSKIDELAGEEKNLIDQLINADDSNEKEPNTSGRSNIMGQITESSTEEQVKLGNITAFGSSLESTQVMESVSILGVII